LGPTAGAGRIMRRVSMARAPGSLQRMAICSSVRQHKRVARWAMRVQRARVASKHKTDAGARARAPPPLHRGSSGSQHETCERQQTEREEEEVDKHHQGPCTHSPTPVIAPRKNCERMCVCLLLQDLVQNLFAWGLDEHPFPITTLVPGRFVLNLFPNRRTDVARLVRARATRPRARKRTVCPALPRGV
jgi:hypothetical protein